MYWNIFGNYLRTSIWLNLQKDTKRLIVVQNVEIKVGELVLIREENLQRHWWRVVVVEELISSKVGT